MNESIKSWHDARAITREDVKNLPRISEGQALPTTFSNNDHLGSVTFGEMCDMLELTDMTLVRDHTDVIPGKVGRAPVIKLRVTALYEAVGGERHVVTTGVVARQYEEIGEYIEQCNKAAGDEQD